MRLFIAISLDPATQSSLAAFYGTLKPKTGNSVRWVKPANIHLTLKFLGEVDQSRYQKVHSKVEEITQQFTPFDLSVNGCGVFPGWRQPRVVWAGVQAPQQLAQLASALESGMQALDFPAEERPFSPHLTLGRVNDWMTPPQKDMLQMEMEAAKGRVFGTIHADHLTIYRSELRPEGPVYSELARSTFSTSKR